MVVRSAPSPAARQSPQGPSRRAALLLGLSAAAVCAGPLAACGRDQAPVPSAFSGLLADWARQMLQDSPELASRAGMSPAQVGQVFNDRLDDRSPAGEATRRAAATRRMTELLGVDPARLSPDERRSHRIITPLLEQANQAAKFGFGTLSAMGQSRPYVISPLSAAFLDLPDFLDTRHPVTNLADAEAYVARLQAAALAISSETEVLRADAAAGVIPPDFALDRSLAQLNAAVGQAPGDTTYVRSFAGKLAQISSTELNARLRTLLADAERIVGGAILPAMRAQAQELARLRPGARSEAGIWRLREGEAYYRQATAAHTTTSLTPTEIHQIGLQRVAELTAALDIALRRVGRTDGPIGLRLAALTADPAYQYPATDEGRAQLLADSSGRIAEVMRLAPQWFGRLPQAKLEVRRVPAAQELASSGAYYQPPSLDGGQPGIYYINLRNLAEMTRIDLPTQDYHEGAPGHHFQIALAQELTGLPLLRRLLGFTAYQEGWALYAEQLIDEQGLYSQDPVGQIGYLRWQMWRAARLVVDTGLHDQRWSLRRAVEYLTQVTGDAPGVITSEAERYAVWPGQALSYEIGRRAFIEERERARRLLGGRFDLKAFHDVVLGQGVVPLSALSSLVGDWIDSVPG